jgi:hypothetical protein
MHIGRKIPSHFKYGYVAELARLHDFYGSGPLTPQMCSAFAASSSSTALAKAQDLIIEGSARVALMTDVVKSGLETFGTRVLVCTVSVHWPVDASAAEPILVFKWWERGGPPHSPPKRKGFGTILLERAVATAEPPRSGFAYQVRATLAQQSQSN